MDRFILLSTVLVFLNLVQTVARAAMVRLVNRIDLVSRAVYPVFLLMILFISFAA